MRGGWHHSPEALRKISEYQKNRTPEHRLHQVEHHTKGGWKLSVETKKRISDALRRRILSEVTLRRMSQSAKGKHSGPLSGRWKGPEGRSTKQTGRTSFEYKQWRRAVFERDNYTCQKCVRRGGRLHAHHLDSWSDVPAKRYEIENGITLCIPCHKNLHRRQKEKVA